MFFKDFDGALREVPQKRVLLHDIELNKLVKAARHGEAAVYGDQVREVLEAYGFDSYSDEGLQVVVKTLSENTQKRRNLDGFGDTKTQKFVAAKLESQSQDYNTNNQLNEDPDLPKLPEEEKTAPQKQGTAFRRGTLVLARGSTPEDDLLGNMVRHESPERRKTVVRDESNENSHLNIKKEGSLPLVSKDYSSTSFL